MKQPERLNLSQHIDDRGSLTFGEIGKDWDFDIKRIYFATGFDAGVVRGGHAHKDLDQVLVLISGKFSIFTDHGTGKKTLWTLDEPGQALRIYSPTWREIESHSSDAVFLALASEVYDENDYIRDYNNFLIYAQTQQEKAG